MNQSQQLRRAGQLWRTLGLLLGLLGLLPRAGHAQLYYTLNDGAATTATDQLRTSTATGASDAAVKTGAAQSPGVLVLDAANNRLLVADTRATTSATANTKIVAVSLSSGNAASTFLTPAYIASSTTTVVSGLALDRANNYLYYVLNDGNAATSTDQLRRVALNGTGDVLLKTGFAQSPGALVLDAANNRLLVADTRATTSATANTKIVAVSLASGNAASTFLTPAYIASSTTTSVAGLALDATNSYLYYVLSDGSATASTDQLRRIGLAGTGDVLVKSGFAQAPGALVLDVPNNQLVVADRRASTSGSPTNTKIVAVSLASGSAVSTLLTPAYLSGSATTTVAGLTNALVVAPTVTTAAATTITSTSAVLGGNVTADGGATVTGRGVVYSSSNPTPTVGGSNTTTAANGSGMGSFSATISGLAPGTSYYVRAYATNSVGTSYGGVQQFTTTQLVTDTPALTQPGSYTNNSTPLYLGTAMANSYVVFYRAAGGSSSGAVQTDTTYANALGNFHKSSSQPLADGQYTVYVTAQAANRLVSANSSPLTFTVDTQRPSVSLSTSAGASGSTTGTTPIPFTVTFSEAVTGFVAGDVTVTNGTITGNVVNGSGTTYTFTVTPATAGTATTVTVPAAVAQDQASNFNTASSTYSLTYTLPTATVTGISKLVPTAAQSATGTATATVSFTVTFSANVSGVSTSNFTLTTSAGLSGASVTSVAGSGTTYTVTANTGTGNGTLQLNVANATGITPSVPNTPYSGTSAVYTITKSFAAAPQLTIQGTGGTGSDVTAFVDVAQVLSGGSPFANGLQNTSFETHGALANGDFGYNPNGASWTFNPQSGIANQGSAFTPTTPIPNGIAVAFVQSNSGGNGQLQQNLAVPTGSNYQVSFQAAQRVCCTTLDQALSVFLNGVYLGTIQPNSNGYSTFTSPTFAVMAPALTATVSTTAGSPTSTSPIPFSVSFSQSVGTTFTASDVTVAGGALTSGSFLGSGSGPYTFTVTPSATGTVTVSLAANVANDANNTGNTASNSLSLQYNQPTTTAPVITSPANNTLTNQAVTFSGTAPANSEVVIYISQSNAAYQQLPPFNAAANGTFSLGPIALPDATFQVYATAQSPGASVSVNSATTTFTVDTTRPSVAISSTAGASGGSTGTTPMPFSVTFSETVNGSFVQGDLTVMGGTIVPGSFSGSGAGPYTFTVTPSSSGSTVSVNVVANVAQDAAGNFNTAAPAAYSLTFQAPTITVAPASLPGGTQNGAYSASFTASGGSGTYTYAITSGSLPSGLSLLGNTISGTPTVNGTFSFQVTATDNSAAPGPYSGSRSYALVIAAPVVTSVVWNGSVSTDWFTAANWTPSQVPDATIDATIPTAPSGNRFPVIAANASQANARNVSIATGAALYMSANTLTVAGNLTNNGAFNGFTGSGSTATGGTVVLGSSALSNILGSSSTRFWNLTVGANGAQQSTSASTSVQRLLTLNGNFATNGNSFTLVSDANGTAMVVNNGSNVVSGNVTVQRYIMPDLNPNLGYRHVSSPISSATVASLTTGSFSPVVNPAYNTSAQPGTVTPFPTVYGYDQSRLATATNNLADFDKGWYSPATTGDVLPVGQGFTALVAAGQTWTFTGPQNNGPVPLALTRNSGATAAASGLALVGNPYPAPLDWSRVTATERPGVDAIMYVFASNDPSNPYAGSYGFYQSGFGTIGPVLPLGQGFFVRVTAGQTAGTLNLNNGHRLTAYSNPTYHRTAETRPVVHLTLKGASSALTDDAFVYFEAGAADGYQGQYDGEKLANPSGLNLSSSLSATQRLCVNGLEPLGTSQKVVPLAVGVPAVGSYVLNAAEVLNLSTVPVYLRDLQTGALIDLAQQPSYQFTVSNAAALITGRFELVFSPQQPLATAPAALVQQVGLYPNPATTSAWLELPASLGRQAIVATLLDAVGREVRTLTLPAQGTVAHQLDLRELATGVYALRLSTSAGVVVKKLVVE